MYKRNRRKLNCVHCVFVVRSVPLKQTKLPERGKGILMSIVVFSKIFKEKNVDELVELALRHGFEGYDLCVRPGYPVSPENASKMLPEAASKMRQVGLDVPMVTGNVDLLSPDHPTAEPILRAMDESDVRLIKLGYFMFSPEEQDYWQEVDRIRKILGEWEKLGRRYGVKICYHTHCSRCMGLNAAALCHLIRGFDPAYIGAYLDTGHMVAEGEEFCFGAAMVRDYLSIVGLKDFLILRENKNGHGTAAIGGVPAGEGMVDWTAVFSELRRIGFNGPLSVHCEFPLPEDAFLDAVAREVGFFKDQRDGVWLSVKTEENSVAPSLRN